MYNNDEFAVQAAGGDLVSIHSEEENALVVSLLAAAAGSPRYVAWTWTGGRDCQPATGECSWSDGTAWDFSNWDAGRTFFITDPRISQFLEEPRSSLSLNLQNPMC